MEPDNLIAFMSTIDSFTTTDVPSSNDTFFCVCLDEIYSANW
jgi:hypothetical protein